MKSYEDRIKAVDKEIDQVGGETIQKRRREVKSAKDRHATMQKEISSTKVKLRSAQKSIKQLEEENVRLSKDIQDETLLKYKVPRLIIPITPMGS